MAIAGLAYQNTNQSNVPGLSSNVDLSNIKFGAGGTPVNMNQAINSGGLTVNWPTPTQAPQNTPAPTQSVSGPNWQSQALAQGKDVNSPEFAALREQYANIPNPISDNQINSAYSEANNAYDSLYNSTLNNRQAIIDSYTRGYDALVPGIKNAYDQGKSLIDTQKVDVQTREENALAQARRLYQELTQGARQRFGGSTSAGEFSNDMLGREFMTNFGNIKNTAGADYKALDQKANEIYGSYQSQMQTLGLQRAKAESDAQLAFQNQLDQITQQKGVLAQNKAQAKLQALSDYRNNLMAIQQQATTFAQNLALQHQATQDQLKAMAYQFAQTANTPYSVNAQSNPAYSTFMQQAQTGQPAYTGIIGPVQPKKEEMK